MWTKTDITQPFKVTCGDSIAYQFYGDTKYIGLLFENNQDLLDIFVFSAGTKVYIPELPDEEDEDIPEWRL